MTYFGGINERKIDEKSRLPIPKDYREGLVDNNNRVFIMARKNKIEIYSTRLGEILTNSAVEVSLSRKASDIKSIIGASTEVKELDAKGRVQISENILKKANISNKSSVLIIGSVDHISIWKPEDFYGLDESMSIDDIFQ